MTSPVLTNHVAQAHLILYQVRYTTDMAPCIRSISEGCTMLSHAGKRAYEMGSCSRSSIGQQAFQHLFGTDDTI